MSVQCTDMCVCCAPSSSWCSASQRPSAVPVCLPVCQSVSQLLPKKNYMKKIATKEQPKNKWKTTTTASLPLAEAPKYPLPLSLGDYLSCQTLSPVGWYIKHVYIYFFVYGLSYLGIPQSPKGLPNIFWIYLYFI